MSDKILQTARFTAQQLADAISQIHVHLPLKIDIVQDADRLYYVVCRTDSTRTSLPMSCATTTVEQLQRAIAEIFDYS